MGAMASQITSIAIVCSSVYSYADKKNRVTGLCAENSLVTGEFSAQMASYAENVSIWWRHHENDNKIMGYSVVWQNIMGCFRGPFY